MCDSVDIMESIDRVCSVGETPRLAQKNDKDWTVQKRLLSARRASQMAVFDNEIERWGEIVVPYLRLS
ncbi:hypothetical protein J6590_062963 [Homalodisca vitripennis]|nr:hypothetical protein J6590_062963 [Homalodisca vitripennis]